jgi:hypothetical protein
MFLFQAFYQSVILFELLFKKFLTKKLNIVFVLPIILILVTLTKTPYDDFKSYKLPNFKMQELMFMIQANLEEYRVKTKYYPKTKDRFLNDITSKINKELITTPYTKEGKYVKTNIIYKFDQNSAYDSNIDNYTAPTVVVMISSSGKDYWITSIIKDSYIDGKDILLSYNGKAFTLKEDILIRDRLRNNDKKEYIYNELIKSLKK